MKVKEIEVDWRRFGVQPKDVELDSCGAAPGGFGKYETELAAGQLIQYFQYRRQWCCFTFTEIRDFYQSNKWDWNGFLFGLIPFMDDYGIIVPPVYIVHTGSVLMVTKEFVDRCMKYAKRKI